MKTCALFVFLFSVQVHAQALEYDRLRIPVSGQWQKKEERGYAVFTRAGKQGGVVMVQSMRGGPELLEPFLTRLMQSHTQGREALKIFPPQIARGASKSGLAFAGQGRVTKSERDTWFCQYFAFDAGGYVQAVILFAETPEAFKELSGIVAPALELAAARTPDNVPSAQLPPPAQGPTSMYQQTGIMSDQFVSAVVTAQSAELKPIPFRLTGAMRMSDDNLVLSGRDASGALYIARSSMSYSVYPEQAAEIHRIVDFGRPQKTGITREFLMKAAAQLGKQNVDLFFRDTSPVHQLAVDRKGNLFIGQTIDKDNAFFHRTPDGTVRLIASPRQLNRLANGYQTNGDASRIRPTAGGNAWLFVQGPETDGKNYGTAAYALLSTPEGFRSMQVVPSWRGKPYDKKAAYTLFRHVMIDPDENLVTYLNNSFWRIDPKGVVTEMLRLPLPADNVTVTGPVMLENGDIWVAFSTNYHVTSYANVTQGSVDIRNTWFMAGDRSRLVRIRLRDGKLELGEISSERFLEALRKTGLARGDSGVMKTAVIRLDYRTGGLLLLDSHHGVLYGVAAD